MEPLNINHCFSFTYIYKNLLAYKVQVCLVFTKMRSHYAYYFETVFFHLKISETSFQIHTYLFILNYCIILYSINLSQFIQQFFIVQMVRLSSCFLTASDVSNPCHFEEKHLVFINWHLPVQQQISLVAQSCLTLCDPMDCSTPGLPVHHRLPEFTQTHVHRVSDAIQPSHPLSSPSPPVFSLSQHQSLFQ